MAADAEEIELAVEAKKALLKAITATANSRVGEKSQAFAEAYAALAGAAPKARNQG